MITHLFNCDISHCTTFHLPAVVAEFIEYDTADELAEIVKILKAKNQTFIHIGGGSNVLFSCRYDGVVLHCRLAEITETRRTSEYVFIHATAGTIWDDFVRYTVDNRLYGAENLSYIPGEVGGAAVQNVGAYGVEAKDIIDFIEVLDSDTGNFETISAKDCDYGYRDSLFKHHSGKRYLVTGVNFRLKLEPSFVLEYGPLKELTDDRNLTISKVRDRIISIRQSKLPEPNELGSAGSFFKNPVVSLDKYNELKRESPNIPAYVLPDRNVKIPAGWLIEHSGLKGYSIGDAEVYPKQCLVIVNKGDASVDDVVRLKKYIQDTVMERFGIEIFPEVNLIGL